MFILISITSHHGESVNGGRDAFQNLGAGGRGEFFSNLVSYHLYSKPTSVASFFDGKVVYLQKV